MVSPPPSKRRLIVVADLDRLGVVVLERVALVRRQRLQLRLERHRDHGGDQPQRDHHPFCPSPSQSPISIASEAATRETPRPRGLQRSERAVRQAAAPDAVSEREVVGELERIALRARGERDARSGAALFGRWRRSARLAGHHVRAIASATTPAGSAACRRRRARARASAGARGRGARSRSAVIASAVFGLRAATRRPRRGRPQRDRAAGARGAGAASRAAPPSGRSTRAAAATCRGRSDGRARRARPARSGRSSPAGSGRRPPHPGRTPRRTAGGRRTTSAAPGTNGTRPPGTTRAGVRPAIERRALAPRTARSRSATGAGRARSRPAPAGRSSARRRRPPGRRSAPAPVRATLDGARSLSR